jgi:hypothetical protein
MGIRSGCCGRTVCALRERLHDALWQREIDRGQDMLRYLRQGAFLLGIAIGAASFCGGFCWGYHTGWNQGYEEGDLSYQQSLRMRHPWGISNTSRDEPSSPSAE